MFKCVLLYKNYLFSGSKLTSKSFDTMYDSATERTMPEYLSNLPSEVFVVVFMHYAGHAYYRPSIPLLKELSGAASISTTLTWGGSWSLLGYKGRFVPDPSWRRSVMKKSGYGPAVIDDVVPKLLGNSYMF